MTIKFLNSIEEFPVEAGQILFFARAIGDNNPIYQDKEYAAQTEVGGIIAPPTFVISAFQYQEHLILRPQWGEPWIGSGKTASGSQNEYFMKDFMTALHAEEHFEYFGLIYPGDVLTVRTFDGGCWEKTGKRGGRISFVEQITEYYNQKKELVVRARWITAITGEIIT